MTKLEYNTVAEAVDHFYSTRSPEMALEWLDRQDEVADHVRDCHKRGLIVVRELS